jgi:hypothetical protein
MLSIYCKIDHALQPLDGMREVLFIAKNEMAAWLSRARLIKVVGTIIAEKAFAVANSTIAAALNKVVGWWKT